MKVAWIVFGGAACTAVLALLTSAPVQAADSSGVTTVAAEELDKRSKQAEEVQGEQKGMSDSAVREIFGEALAALPPPPRRFTLNFRFESNELTEESQALLPGVLRVIRERQVPDVVVVGHTDTMGAPAANYALGLKRAMMVRELLVEAGLSETFIEVISLGETDLAIRTADETPEPRNRRVDIAVR